MCALTFRSAPALPVSVFSLPRRSFALPGVP